MSEGGVTRHYGGEGLLDRILGVMERAGHDLENLTVDQLSTEDHMHIRGVAATHEAHDLLGPAEDDHVLDVGCGIAGPARMLAAETGCTVTGLDLTPAFCETARALNEITGLADQVEIVEGSATDMPFEDEAFDHAITLHASMNIEDKPALYAEVARVLSPGGRFLLYDVMAGEGGPLHFPVMWAATQEISFLEHPDAVRAKVEASGLTCVSWEDLSALTLDWMEEVRAKRAAAKAAGKSIDSALVRDGFEEKLNNVHRNLVEDRIRLARGVFRKA